MQKRRVEPPVAFSTNNQFEKDLNHLYSDLRKLVLLVRRI
jgi:hypothetical protein